MKTVAAIEEEELAVCLWAHGVRVLALATEPASTQGRLGMGVARLSAALASTTSPLLRSCLPPLLLAHADRAAAIRQAVGGLAAEDALRLRALYTVAVCLQRLWWTRLSLFAPSMPRLEDAFSAELGLPDPERMYGRLCLSAIDQGMVQDCQRTFAVFLEGREREHKLAETTGGRG